MPKSEAAPSLANALTEWRNNPLNLKKKQIVENVCLAEFSKTDKRASIQALLENDYSETDIARLINRYCSDGRNNISIESFMNQVGYLPTPTHNDKLRNIDAILAPTNAVTQANIAAKSQTMRQNFTDFLHQKVKAHVIEHIKNGHASPTARRTGRNVLPGGILVATFEFDDSPESNGISHNFLSFDPQGTAMIEIDLETNDLACEFFQKKYEQEFANHTEALNELRRNIGAVCEHDSSVLFNIDMIDATNPESTNVFLEQLPNKPALRTAYANCQQRRSITPLQQEAEFRLQMLFRYYETVIMNTEQAGIDFHPDSFKAAKILARTNITKVVHQFFNGVIEESYEPAKDSINIKALNTRLDSQRKILFDTILGEVKYQLLQTETLTLSAARELREKSQSAKQTKKILSNQTASHHDVLTTSNILGEATYISGTEHTAHDKRLGGSHLALRPLIRSFDDGGLTVRMRVPSISANLFKDGTKPQRLNNTGLFKFLKSSGPQLTSEEVVPDNVEKMRHIVDQYNKLQFHVGEPIYYNLLTNLYGRFSEKASLDVRNKQTRSARRIMRASHLFNKEQLELGRDNELILVQNISVNYHGLDLKASKAADTVKEATIMSEIAFLRLLHDHRKACFDDADAERLRGEINSVFAEYKVFVRCIDSSDPRHHFFSSEQGKRAATKISNIKQTYATQIKNDDVDNIKVAAARMLTALFTADQLGMTNTGMMQQQLLVFLENRSVFGCKSAIERAALVENAVAMLDSMHHHTSDEMKDRKEELIKGLTAYTAKPNQDTLRAARSCLDTLHTQTNQYGVMCSVGLQDWGANYGVMALKHGVRPGHIDLKDGITGVRAIVDTNYVAGMDLSNLVNQHSLKEAQAHKLSPQKLQFQDSSDLSDCKQSVTPAQKTKSQAADKKNIAAYLSQAKTSSGYGDIKELLDNSKYQDLFLRGKINIADLFERVARYVVDQTHKQELHELLINIMSRPLTKPQLTQMAEEEIDASLQSESNPDEPLGETRALLTSSPAAPTN